MEPMKEDHLMLLVLLQFCILTCFCTPALCLLVFSVKTLPRVVLQWLLISSLWACLWTLMMVVSRTTGGVDTS